MAIWFVNVRTVSDAKRDFYTHHTRPINSVYRRFVEELLVEMHLLSVNIDFRSDAIYALGVVTSFERFMQGYKPETDKASIFAALCQATGGNAEQYRQQAGDILAQAKQISLSDLVTQIAAATPTSGENSLVNTLIAIAGQPNYKYSRLFAIGLYTLLAEADLEIVKDRENLDRAIKQLSEALHFSSEKLQKDLDLYRSNLDKMDQLLNVLEEALESERKKRQQQEQERKTAPINNDKPSSET
jgi:photosystem II biogenesis protein Psp29